MSFKSFLSIIFFPLTIWAGYCDITIGDWNIQVISIQGKVATQRLVNGIQNIRVQSGTWIVHGIGPQGQVINKFVSITR